MDFRTTFPYHTIFVLAASAYAYIVVRFWKQVYSRNVGHSNMDAVVLMIVATLLGGLWIISAYAEGLYLGRRIGDSIPNQFHYQLMGITMVLVIWGFLMMLSAKGSLLPYSILYFVYVSIASFVNQPINNRTIVAVMIEPEVRAKVPGPTADAIIEYYSSAHWAFVASESVGLSALAIVLAYLWRKQGLTLWKDFWRSPHLVLIIEFLLSQILIWYHRFRLYDQQ